MTGNYLPLDDGEVLKLVFEASHAPYYVMQLDCGFYVSMYAAVEYSDPSLQRPVHAPRQKLVEYIGDDTVTVITLAKENSPFRERPHPDERDA